ncbi:hypothetical protein DYQ86_22715 [Acidobacteria bacterium AB60]|nr:hypothetical protein DYQ86_22715 [Acidobacteria bacterium AB60]
MKRLTFCALILALLSVPALAEKNTETVKFPDAVKVGATQLPAGSYKVSWEGTGSNVQVTLEQKDTRKPVSATVTAKVTEEKSSRNSFTLNSEGNINTLHTLQFSKYNVVIAPPPEQGQ